MAQPTPDREISAEEIALAEIEKLEPEIFGYKLGFDLPSALMRHISLIKSALRSVPALTTRIEELERELERLKKLHQATVSGANKERERYEAWSADDNGKQVLTPAGMRALGDYDAIRTRESEKNTRIATLEAEVSALTVKVSKLELLLAAPSHSRAMREGGRE